ncbi:MAG: DotD/TraH family lipoprotein [Candidatus Adiutrix sp.]
MRYFYSFILIVLLFATNGCVASKKIAGPDPAQEVLSQAVIDVHDEMMTVSLILGSHKKNAHENLLPEHYSLMVPIEFNWLGPAWPAIEALASRLDYVGRLQGRRPLNDPTITVKGTLGQTGYDLLSDINWQLASSGGSLHIDSIKRVITLVYK